MKDLIKAYIRAQDDPFKAQSYLKDMVYLCVSEVVKEKYITVVFDSPDGSHSERVLQDKGYCCKWIGHIGYRGETKVYLDKREKAGDFIEKLKKWDLLDKYSNITTKGE